MGPVGPELEEVISSRRAFNLGLDALRLMVDGERHTSSDLAGQIGSFPQAAHRALRDLVLAGWADTAGLIETGGMPAHAFRITDKGRAALSHLEALVELGVGSG